MTNSIVAAGEPPEPTDGIVPVSPQLPVWKPLLFGAFAGGMAWGIRGQYGHETGAMIAGLLLSATLTLLCGGTRLSGFDALRAVAWGTIAMGFGGSMTYGQTVGLTHDPELVGHRDALLWGMLGLAIKGGLWIGFGGVFLGMGLGGKRYRPLEMLAVMVGLLMLCWLGIQLLNEPFDPAQRRLPRWYFSDDWRWEPGASLKPRREVWGGMLFAWLGLMSYVRYRRQDILGFRLGWWGLLGGALGFPLGQCLQAYHAWHPEIFHAGIWIQVDPLINWWNWMETTFGAVMGAVLGLGLWLNRDSIRPWDSVPIDPSPAWVGCVLLAIHVPLLVFEQFFSVRWINELYDFGLILGFLPILGVVVDRSWSYWIIPITVLPIAGKTLKELVYQQHAMAPSLGWILYLIIPLGLAVGLAVWLRQRAQGDSSAHRSLRPLVLVAAWLFFGLNYAFFHFPWPWRAWTVRTPNAIAFTVCLVGLTWIALQPRGARSSNSGPEKSHS